MVRKTNRKVLKGADRLEDTHMWLWRMLRKERELTESKARGPEVVVCTLIEQNLWPDSGRNKRLVIQRSKLQKSPEDDKIKRDAAHRNRLFLGSTNWLHFSAVLMEPDTKCSKRGCWPLGSQLTATVSSPGWNVPFLSSYCWLLAHAHDLFLLQSHIITLKAFWCPHNKYQVNWDSHRGAHGSK